MTSRRRGRAAAFIGAHLLALAGLYGLCVAPIVTLLQAQRDEIEEKGQILTRSQETLSRLDVQAGATPAPRAVSWFLTAQNDGLGAAALQTQIKTLIEPQGAFIGSQRATPSRTLGRLTLRSARVELAGTIGALANAVRSLETSEAPALFIVGASVRPASSGASVDGASPPQLEVQLDVEAPFLSDGEAP